jgi:hypothetical protein
MKQGHPERVREKFSSNLYIPHLWTTRFGSPSGSGLGLALPSGVTINGERSDLRSGHAGEWLVFI